MFKTAPTFVAVVIAGALVAVPLRAYAQFGSGFSGPRGMSPSSTLQSLDQAGPSTLKHGKSDDEQIKDAKRKIIDADPRVRVVALEDLRYVGDKPEVTELLFRGANDADVRVRIKGIDVLGARGVNDAVPLMSQALFLRETPAVEKLHLVAALGRIGDARGALPILEYLDEVDDPGSRGTAVFALGEIGDPSANDKLIEVVTNDKTEMVRKLAQEALEKIGGELPNHQQEQAKADRDKALEPTDQKLAKLREMDAEMRKQRGY
jgi:HEAT repeat protein